MIFFPRSYVLFALGLAMAMALLDASSRPESHTTIGVMLFLSLIVTILHRRAARRLFFTDGETPSDCYKGAWAKFVEAIDVLMESPSKTSALRALQVTAHILPTLRRNPADEKFLPNPESEPLEFLSTFLCPKPNEGDIKDLVINRAGVFLIPGLPVLPALTAYLGVNLVWALAATILVTGAISARTVQVVRKAQMQSRWALEALQVLRSNEGGATP